MPCTIILHCHLDYIMVVYHMNVIPYDMIIFIIHYIILFYSRQSFRLPSELWGVSFHESNVYIKKLATFTGELYFLHRDDYVQSEAVLKNRIFRQ